MHTPNCCRSARSAPATSRAAFSPRDAGFPDLFAVYPAHFGAYDKTWGSLSAVIVMLTWLWLSALALLLGAEIDAQIERRNVLRGRASPAKA